MNLLGLGVASASLGLLKLGLEEGVAVVEGDGLLILGGKLGLGSSELALSGLGAGSGSISLTAEGLEFLPNARKAVARKGKNGNKSVR
jgi:hypothetical protein